MTCLLGLYVNIVFFINKKNPYIKTAEYWWSGLVTTLCFCSQVLNGSFSLELVSEKYWKVNKPMELYFAPTKEHK